MYTLVFSRDLSSRFRCIDNRIQIKFNNLTMSFYYIYIIRMHKELKRGANISNGRHRVIKFQRKFLHIYFNLVCVVCRITLTRLS